MQDKPASPAEAAADIDRRIGRAWESLHLLEDDLATISLAMNDLHDMLQPAAGLPPIRAARDGPLAAARRAIWGQGGTS